MNPEISIIIVNRNRSDLLLNCLKSISDNPCRRSYEIIIVDNASIDDSIKLIEQNFKNIKLIKNQINKGFSAANNQALKIAAGRLILFLNSDTIVSKDSIDTMAEFLEKTPQAALCTPKLLNPDGSIQPNVYHFTTFRSILARYIILKYFGLFKKDRNFYKMRDFSYDRIEEIDRPMGAAMLAKKDALEKIDNFDERFFFYFEDADICLRLKKTGFKIYFIPDAQIIHIGGASSKSLGSHKTDMMFYKSMFYYFRKHRGKFNTFLFSLIFKPAVILYYLTETIVNFIMFHRLEKSKSAALFLSRFLLEFLLC